MVDVAELVGCAGCSRKITAEEQKEFVLESDPSVHLVCCASCAGVLVMGSNVLPGSSSAIRAVLRDGRPELWESGAASFALPTESGRIPEAVRPFLLKHLWESTNDENRS